MEIDVSEPTNGYTNETRKDNSSLKPVPRGASGEGLPYAPSDWPNRGDIWIWKVGNKINPSGYYTHRFLLVPKRLQKSPTRKIWLGSKPAVTRYLQSEFPKADIHAFFASFTWEIPADTMPRKAAKNGPSTQRATPTNETESGSRVSKRTRSSAKRCIRLKAHDTTTSTDVHLPERLSADLLNTDITANENNEAYDAGQLRASNSLADHLAQMTSEDFDFYINSLDDMLSQSVSLPPNPVAEVYQIEDFAKAREKLSVLLAMDFRSLIISNKLPEVTNLSSMLQSDPNLSPGELSILNLIRDIPLASKRLHDAKQVTAEADKFFVELEANIARISALKTEYMFAKDKLALLQAEDATASSTIREIDEEIALLQSRRATLVKVVKKNEKKIAELTSSQKQVFDSIPKIVDEVQIANSERSQWEMKKNEAAKHEAEILAKFAPLEGFSFIH